MDGLFDLINAEKKQSLKAIRSDLQERLPWLIQPGFYIGRHEGYDGRAFGARAGPHDNINTKNVLHEVAHAVELTLLPTKVWKRRIKYPQYNMKVKSFVTVMGERYYEPVTMQATERECRVGGIQLRLLEMGDYQTKDFTEEFTITLKYMADYYMGGSCPLNTPDPADYDEQQQLWFDTRVALIKQSYDRFTPQEITERWSSVMTFLNKSKNPEAVQSAHRDSIIAMTA